MIAFVMLTAAAPASAYDLKSLSAEDILTIGAGLDKLPREASATKPGGPPGLFDRIQHQIDDQNHAAQAAAEAAMRARIASEKSPIDHALPLTEDKRP